MPPPKMGEEWNAFVAKNPLLLLPTSIEEFRAAKYRRGLETQNLLAKPEFSLLVDNIIVEDTLIRLPEVTGHTFRVRLYRSATKTTETLPVMLYFHGGYWCSGDANSEDLGCRAIIARGNNIIIASFEYRLVPEVGWQTVFTDAEYAMKWMAFNAESIGGDTSKGFLVGGAEAGAHLAAICAIRARVRYPNINITGQNLIVPTTIAWPDPNIPEACVKRLQSHEENAEAPVLNEKLYEMFVSALGVPDQEKRRGENFPMWGPLDGLPPAYIPVDEFDPIRDQGLLYAELLAEAGFPELPSTLKAGGHLAAGIAWLLQERK